MKDAYDKKLADLKQEIEFGGARPSIIDETIVVLAEDGDTGLVADLLCLLSDEATHDEGMFSLIHAA